MKIPDEDGNVSDSFVISYITKHSAGNERHLFKRAPKPGLAIPILHEIITEPSIILNARGIGKHQTMQLGDSLKFEDGECLPLLQAELDVAWKIFEKKQELSEKIGR